MTRAASRGCAAVLLVLTLFLPASPSGAGVDRSAPLNDGTEDFGAEEASSECAADSVPREGDRSSSRAPSSFPPPPLPPPPPPGCRLFLARSTIPGGGLGIFAARPARRGTPAAPADVAIQLTDVPGSAVAAGGGMSLLVRGYLRDGRETGGQHEGKTVYTASPGVGMLANGHRTLHNVIPHRPDVNEADLPRTASPGAGAITHYHNYSYYVHKPIPAGGEILISMGRGWFDDREASGEIAPLSTTVAEEHVRSVEWLREHGMCLDNLRAGRSGVKEAGRGAFATRHLPEGIIVAPAPVIPIFGRDSFDFARPKAKKSRQLLLNYCYGHTNSSVLLFPYSPVVNLINHASDRREPNAALRWSGSDQHDGRDWPGTLTVEELATQPHAGLMLEFVALRDIEPGEEVLIDYGPEWRRAWDDHKRDWKPPPGAQAYTPSYIMDDVAGKVRTEEEQRNFPYPENVAISCFYRYSDNRKEAEAAAAGSGGSSSSGRSETTAFEWKLSRGIFNYGNLRPCKILRRDQGVKSRGGEGREGENIVHLYTVMIQNRYGLAEEERIPKGEVHVIRKVPRQAIRFTDKLYTTDQHLPNAFRHEIGLPEGVFPHQWMDLA